MYVDQVLKVSAGQRTLARLLTLGGSADVGPPLDVGKMGVHRLDGTGVHRMRMGGNLLTIPTRVGPHVVARVKVLLTTLF